MSLTLEITSRHSRSLGKDRSMTFGQDGGTIGRSLAADWSLPDGQRFLSNRHASIDFRSGAYYIVDTSKNGVFINGSDTPVGRGKPQRLFPGDSIRIGDYEMSVSIQNVDDTRETMMSTSHVDPVELRQRVDRPDPTCNDLLDAHAMTGAGIEMHIENDDSELFEPIGFDVQTGGTGGHDEPAAASPELDADEPVELALADSQRSPAQAPSADRSAPRSGSPLDAFFHGAGISQPSLSDAEQMLLMTQCGQVLRELLVGIIECLHLRALHKAQLKQGNTTIGPRDNNRLKFSASFEEAFARMFLEESSEYASAVDSARGAFIDIRHHQQALFNGTREALLAYLERLDPMKLTESTSHGRKGAILNAANRLKFFDLYKDVYSILADAPANEFPQPFLDAMAAAYRETEPEEADGAAAEAARDAG